MNRKAQAGGARQWKFPSIVRVSKLAGSTARSRRAKDRAVCCAAALKVKAREKRDGPQLSKECDGDNERCGAPTPAPTPPTLPLPSGVEQVRLLLQLQLTVEELHLPVGLGDVLSDKVLHVCGGEPGQGNNGGGGVLRGCRPSDASVGAVGKDTGMEAPPLSQDVHVVTAVVEEARWERIQASLGLDTRFHQHCLTSL